MGCRGLHCQTWRDKRVGLQGDPLPNQGGQEGWVAEIGLHCQTRRDKRGGLQSEGSTARPGEIRGMGCRERAPLPDQER